MIDPESAAEFVRDATHAAYVELCERMLDTRRKPAPGAYPHWEVDPDNPDRMVLTIDTVPNGEGS